MNKISYTLVKCVVLIKVVWGGQGVGCDMEVKR